MHYSVLIQPQGPLISVSVGVSAARRQALIQANQPVPNPVLVSLLLDTGAFGSALDATVIAQLGLQPTGNMNILTPSTGANTHPVSTYDVEMTFPGATPTKVFPAVAVIDGHYLTQGHHGLVGRNVLAESRLIYSGPDGGVMISF